MLCIFSIFLAVFTLEAQIHMVLGRKRSVQAPPAVTRKMFLGRGRQKVYIPFFRLLTCIKRNLEESNAGDKLKLEMRISTISLGKEISSWPMQIKPRVSSIH